MQHLDEGTIHAWLDGALTADEAARAEAHVKDCAQCQAAVAEARGFIAASSRILTALDHAPRGVIPAIAPKKRVQPWVWRVAATVLVVATGTVLLVRERTSKGHTEMAARMAQTEGRPVISSTTAADSVSGDVAPTRQAAPTSASARAAAPRTFSTAPPATPSRRIAKTDQSVGGIQGGARVDEQQAAAAERTRVQQSTPAATPPVLLRGPSYGALSSVAVETPRQVGMKRTIGKTETFYEIAPGDTVVLEEQARVNLESVVVTGAATNRAAQPMVRAGKAAAVAEPQQKAEAAPAAAPPPPAMVLQDAQNPEIHRISWLDPSTGQVVILSGRHSQEELQDIRKKIQQLRDTAAQSKKLPD